jgi:hypothetical protein
MNQQGFFIAPTSSGVILDNHERNEDLHTYESGIREFNEKYDIDATNLNMFIVAFANKAQKTGWNSILEIPRDPNDPQAGTDNLITKYGGVIPLERRVKNWTTRILSEQSRQAQDENMTLR